ncbi:MAG: 50S ribosomal protein L10 [Actinomycetota bacterium]|nr:MAG: 50S ribosomal protein L10 [Actinomycetota bacterium]
MERTPKPIKVAKVDELKERFDSSSAILLTEYRGLKVSELESLRRRLKANGGEYKIFKNTFVRFVAKDKGLADLVPLLEGPTGLTFVESDAAQVAKAIRDFSRENPALIIKGGLLGDAVVSAKEITALADLPSRDVLLAKLAGGLAAPMQKFAGLLQAIPQSFAYALSALIAKGGAGGAAEAVQAVEPVPEVVAEVPAEESSSGEISSPEAEEPQAEG